MKINTEDHVEMVDIDLDIDGTVKAPLNGLIALIDADTLAYTSCLNTEQQEDLMSIEMYTQNEWLNIKSNPNYDEELHCIWTLNLDIAYQKALEKLDRIYDKTGCRECEMYFTTGKSNFRYEVFPEYKANRTGRSPTDLNKLKTKLLENFKGEIRSDIEADDIVVYLKNSNPDKYIMVAIDKDLLFSTPGTHFNYYESGKYNIEMKWTECDEHTAITWPFIQALMGDKTDNIEGLYKVGPVKAKKILAGCTTADECWYAVKLAYENAGKTQIDALIAMRLVHMHQWNGEKVVLWQPNL